MCGICLSVRHSVTLVFSIEKSKRFFKFLSPSGSHTILFFPTPNLTFGNIPTGTLLTGASLCGVCPSVLLSVTFVYCVKTSNHILELFLIVVPYIHAQNQYRYYTILWTSYDFSSLGRLIYTICLKARHNSTQLDVELS